MQPIKTYFPHTTIVCTLLLLVFMQCAKAQFPHRILDKQTHSLQCYQSSDPLSQPILLLNTSEKLNIAFDRLGHEEEYLSYRLIHCNRNWTPSDISEMDYIDGFNNNPLRTGRRSFNTYIQYTNYTLELPNEVVRPTQSGNYRVEIFSDSNPEQVILQACFAIVEPSIDFEVQINNITDIDYKSKHQQIEVEVNTRNYSIRSPQQELHLVVAQNRRTDNMAITSTPLIQSFNQLIYKNNRDLIFQGTNEFRRFEMTQFRYSGLGVERNRYIDPCYNVTLTPLESRANKPYLYDQDQNGSYLIRTLNSNDSDCEADYALVFFSIPSDDPLRIGKLYLGGAFNNYQFNESSQLKYNFGTRAFESCLFLKQGAYNFMVFNPANEKGKYETSLFEGNFYETQNEYTLLFYHRAFGERYDRIIGYQILR